VIFGVVMMLFAIGMTMFQMQLNESVPRSTPKGRRQQATLRRVWRILLWSEITILITGLALMAVLLRFER